MDVLTGDLVVATERLQQPFRQNADRQPVGVAWQTDHEFIATDAGKEAVAADRFLNVPGRRDDDFVSQRMTKSIIDGFQIIHIDKE